MKKLIVLILFLFVSVGCSQTLPSFVQWDYDYQYTDSTKMTSQDSADIEFKLYYSADSLHWDYLSEAGTIKEKEVYLLQFKWFYNDVNWYIYCTAEMRTLESDPSNTIKVYFPKIKPDAPYLLKSIKLKL